MKSLILILLTFCLACSALAEDGFYSESGVEVVRVRVYSPKQLLDRQAKIRLLLTEVGLDLKAVGSAVGSIQGSSQRSSSFSLQGSYAPLVPGPDKTMDKTVTSYDENGNVVSIERTSQLDGGRVQSEASLSESQGAKNFDIAAPTLGLSPQDLLDAQLELETYKTMLNYAGSGLSYQNRRYVLAAFEVDVQPKPEHCGQAVEISLEVSDKDKINVDQHFPIRRTYNVLEVVENRSDIGLGIVLWPISLGGRGGSAEKTAYLVKDYEVESFSGTSSVFGWRIRPVLNRKFIKPGKRTFYALLSIDMRDVAEVEKTQVSLSEARASLTAISQKSILTPEEREQEGTLRKRIKELETKQNKLNVETSAVDESLSYPDRIPRELEFKVRTRWVSLKGKQGIVKWTGPISSKTVSLDNPTAGKSLAPVLLQAGGDKIAVTKTEVQVQIPCDNVGEFPEVYIGNKSVGDVNVVKYYDPNQPPEDRDDDIFLGELGNRRWLIFTVGPDYLKEGALLTIRTDWGSDTKSLEYVLGMDDFASAPKLQPRVVGVELVSDSPGKALLRIDGQDLEEESQVTVAGQRFRDGIGGFDRVSKNLILIEVPVQTKDGKLGGSLASSKVEVFGKDGTRLWSSIVKRKP